MYFLLMIIACFPEIRKGEEERFIDNPSIDNDGDGFSEEEGDCNDRDDQIHPGTEEICDGVDNDCNEIIDDNPSDIEMYYQDADGDGFGVEGNSILSCPADKPSGYIEAKERNGVVVFDCDDTPPENGDSNGAAFYPDAEEVCDELDNDCDDLIDEEIDTAPIWYLDNDNDTFGDITQILKACPVNGDQPPAGYVDNSADCDDNNGLAFPNAAERCNDIDDNCNGVVDEASASDAPLWYADSDSDGFGSVLNVVPSCDQPSIELSDGTTVTYVSDNTDCNDSDPQVSPNGIESCDSIDNDCDGFIDEGSGPDAPEDAITFYADLDGDGYGSDDQSILQCTAPSGFVSNATDCDDFSVGINPSVSEICNGVDDNCDGTIDEAGAIGEAVFYADLDGDGYGVSNMFQSACTVPVGYAPEFGDCDDSDASIFPTAIEVCDEIDNNCDALIDDADPMVMFGIDDVWFMDGDGDGFGVPGSPVQQCLTPLGYVDNTDDCNDSKAFQYPGASERCNNQDDDCDGVIDNDPVNMSEWYLDGDSDGHGALMDLTSISTTHPDGYDVLACPYFDPNTGLPGFQPGHSPFNDDCNDADVLISPSANELCTQNVDENCDGAPLAGATDFNTYVVDFDMDGYANSTSRPNGELIYAFESCQKPLGYIPYNFGDLLDCNDSDTDVHPNGAVEHTHQVLGGGSVTHTHTEQINGKVDLCENDWNGDLTPPHDEWDDDGDGYVEGAIDVQFLYNSDGTVNGWESTQTIYGGEDCDDSDLFAYPLAEEICNGAFEDCFASDYVLGGSPWLETDDDGDGYVECSGYDTSTWEAAPVTGGDDCNDNIADLFPRIHPDTQLATCFADYDGDGYPDRDWGFCDTALSIDDSELLINGADGRMGSRVASAGDVDGDGLDDVLVSAPYNSDSIFFAGAVYLFLGSTLNTTGSLDTTNADYIFYGESGQDNLGVSVASVGDVDGDGLDDIMFGTTGFDDGGNNIGNVGKVYLFWGANLINPGVIDVTTADISIVGEIGGESFGQVVVSARDVDGDGLDDVLLGASTAEYDQLANVGKTYLFLGSSLTFPRQMIASEADTIFVGMDANEFSGSAISSAGDVDDDGLDDIMIGAYNAAPWGAQTGRTYIFSASDVNFGGITQLSDASYFIHGEDNYDQSGNALSFVGDVDGGGTGDLFIFASGNDQAGGTSGKGYLLLGENLPPSGIISLADADFAFRGEQAGDQLGKGSVATFGDTDGDGLSDLIFGSYLNDENGSDSGKAYLFLGAGLNQSGTVSAGMADYIFSGNEEDHLSQGMAFAGDVNGDGLSDIVLGAPYSENAAGKMALILACEQ